MLQYDQYLNNCQLQISSDGFIQKFQLFLPGNEEQTSSTRLHECSRKHWNVEADGS